MLWSLVVIAKLCFSAYCVDIVPSTPSYTDDGQYVEWSVDPTRVSWHTLSAPIGEVGNTVLNGHSTTAFAYLDDLKVGDVVAVGKNKYTVTTIVIVTEKGASLAQRVENAKWIQPTNDERITMVTCYGDGQRLIVVAK